MKTLLLCLMIGIIVLSCQDDSVNPPVAKFEALNLDEGELSLAVYDAHSLINHSVDADSYLWDYGNGTTSNQKDAILMYTEPGIYTLTLTATNASGMKSTSSVQVKVYHHVVRSVTIKNLNLNVWTNGGRGFPDQPLPVFTNVSLWVEIKKPQDDTYYPLIGDIDAPVIYKSITVSNIAADNPTPISFSVAEEIIVDVPALTHNFGYEGIGYVFNLYAQDNTGTYLVSSNRWSGTGIQFFFGGIKTNNFTIASYGLGGGEIHVQGTYELP